MAFTCEYCGSPILAGDSVCPNCGAPAPDAGEERRRQNASGIPATIGELQAFCRAHHMPLESMRFFIGKDTASPRAFGIFRDGGDFVVYKNKSDGTRAIRYRGPDEAAAVREIYRKLRDEVSRRRGEAPSVRAAAKEEKPSLWSRILRNPIILALAAFLAIGIVFRFVGQKPSDGYYHYEDSYYYCQRGDWYLYDYSLADWFAVTSVNQELQRNANKYYESYEYQDEYAVTDFDFSRYSDSDLSASSDRTDDSDYVDESEWEYDYDSWDAADTDWDSDW